MFYMFYMFTLPNLSVTKKNISKKVMSDMLPRDEGRQDQCLGPGEQTSACGTKKKEHKRLQSTCFHIESYWDI